MLRFEMTAKDLSRSRFALSPAFELNNLLRRLHGTTVALPPAWRRRFAASYAQLRREHPVGVVHALNPAHYGATFIVTPPVGLTQSFDDDLAALRATPLAEARQEIAYCLSQHQVEDPEVLRLLRSRAIVDLVGDIFERAWELLLAAEWPAMRAVCERDVVHRSVQLAHGGWEEALRELHRRVSWRDGGIELSPFSTDQVVPLRGEGLLLIPSATAWNDISAHTEDPWPKALIYPARGTAVLFEPAAARDPAALGALVGRTRARLLMALDSPASTSQLAATMQIALGATGNHLAVLRAGGLVTGTRAGRSVLYRRTPLADALVGAAE